MRGAAGQFGSVVELIPESYLATLDLPAIFGRIAPLQVDLGCGDGSFLARLATRHPEQNFLGIERLLGRIRSSTHKARNLPNVRVLRLETSYAIRYLLPNGSVEMFHLLFPDPWPKRRHQRRRIVTNEFLESISAALAPNGAFRVVTDQRDYFDYIRELLAQTNSFQIGSPEDNELEFPESKFERGFKAQGAPIYRLILRKVSPVR